MNLNDELIFRISSAADFLHKFQKNNIPIFELKSKQFNYNCPMLIRLNVINALLVASDFLDRKSLRQKASDMFDIVRSQMFQENNLAFIVDEGKSFTAFNAMAAIICMKLNDPTACRYLESVQKCIHDKGVFAEYPKSNNNAALVGRIATALFLGHEHYKQKDFLNSGAFLLDATINDPVDYEPEQMAALKYIYSHTPDPKYKKRMKRIFKNFKHLSNNLTSLMAAVKQQSFLVADLTIDEHPTKLHKDSTDLLKYQFDLQVTPKNNFKIDSEWHGSFVLYKNKSDIRADYAAHNLLSMINYCNKFFHSSGVWKGDIQLI